MKAAIYNPYLDSLGGGERYTMAVATSLIKAGYQVKLEFPDKKIKTKLGQRFGIDLKDVEVVKSINTGDGYDVCFWVSDGSIPTLRARKNLLHFQIPFQDVNGRTLLNKMKLFRVNHIVCNSRFTKKVIDQEYGVQSVVVYPPVDTQRFKPKRKENLILGVGRFSQLKQSKHQDILVKAFKKFFDQGQKDWHLVLAGGVEVGVTDFLQKLKKDALGYPIKILESPDFKTLTQLYGQAKIFVSASGFGVDEEKNPEEVEHFGITVVEAMSAKAVPLVFAAGGHKETVENGKNGFLWRQKGQLVKQLTQLAKDQKKINALARQAKVDAEKYSYPRFEKEIINLLTTP